MKSLFSFVAGIALIGLATSCSSDSVKKATVTETKKEFPSLYHAGPQITVSDTVKVYEKKTYKGKVCATGEEYTGKYWKLKGDSVISHTFTVQGEQMSPDSLAALAGNTIVNNTDCPDNSQSSSTTKKDDVSDDSNSSSDSFGSGGTSNPSAGSGPDFNWLKNLLAILFALLCIGLLIWGLWWLFKQKPQERTNNSSQQKTKFMSTDASNQERINALNGIIAGIKGPNGEGKGMIEDKTTEGFKIVVGEGEKPSTPITIFNKGNNVNIIIGSGDIKANRSIGAVEPKKDEPVADKA